MSALFDINPKVLADKLAEQLYYPSDLVNQTFALSNDIHGNCLFIETMADKEQIDNYILRVFREGLITADLQGSEDLIPTLIHRIPLVPVSAVSDFDSCVRGLLDGQCILLLPHANQALLLDAANPAHRDITEPQTETTVRGPREGLTEDIKLNLSLLRKRIKTPGFRMEQYELGTTTQTKIIIAYLQELAPADVVNDFRSRLQSIHTDGVIGSSYVEEWIQDSMVSPFPTLLESERPDVVASHLLEGRVVVLVDGTPFALIGPITFFQLFTAPEDYYQRADIATMLRWLRMLAFLLAILVPSVFIAVMSYHQELLPNPLLINIAAQREGVPFPAYIEAILMLTTFEVLREAGLRMPRVAGQAISIVGALVLGEAAVQAGLVTAAMVIVVAVTAISNFVSPSYSFGIAQRLLQFAYMALGGFMGLFGIMCGVLFTIVHLASLKSFSVPYLAPIAPTFISDWKDILVRVPRPLMKTYPRMNRSKRNRR
ncbi:spore germination protein [Paenibacillus mendelii]|uniref:Spore germination protein n=1 Tax=Paenibacillus mendelii TaxID=206163 RepID=A0ABV6J4E5_9BACL|nr:spore germination protein [Paenibacillus mendelii]MCQ6561727.1 spore germination protein [Paenibacillus mendelii]